MSSDISAIHEALRTIGLCFETGLTAGEISRTEAQYGFQFPPDLREFLSLGLPVSDRFPDWRTGKIVGGKGSLITVADLLDWPAHGICFDVENGGFWIDEWGPKPYNVDEACRLARNFVKQAPALIPVYGHRFLPAGPAAAGNPVLSVYQTDIIYYGSNLSSYFAKEFKLPLENLDNGSRSQVRIRFWSDIIDRADERFLASQRGS